MFYIYIFHKLYRLNLVTKLSVLVSISPYKNRPPQTGYVEFHIANEGRRRRQKEKEKVESREKRAVRAEKKKRWGEKKR